MLICDSTMYIRIYGPWYHLHQKLVGPVNASELKEGFENYCTSILDNEPAPVLDTPKLVRANASA